MIEGLAYLATPYSRYSAGLERAFVDAAVLAANLLLCGVKVYSPIAHTHPIAQYGGLDPLDHAIWLPFDMAMMERCDAMIVAHLDGWDKSYGIAEEVKVFTAANKPIYDLDPRSLVMTRRPWLRPVRERHDARAAEELTAERDSYLNQGMR